MISRNSHDHPGIGWVQLPLAGVEDVFAAGAITHEQQWTSAEGAYAEPVASTRSCSCWRGCDNCQPGRGRALGQTSGRKSFDQPVTIVGAGGITVALLKLLAPFRAHVTVVRPRPEPLEGAKLTVGSEHLKTRWQVRAFVVAGSRADRADVSHDWSG